MKKSEKKFLTFSPTSVKVHFDGGCWPNPGGRMKSGVYIPHLNLKQSITYGEGTNNIAEYLAVRDALILLIDHHLEGQEIEVLGDSRLIINQINGKWRVKNKNLKQYYNQVVTHIKVCKNIKFHWIPREQNSIADSLTN